MVFPLFSIKGLIIMLALVTLFGTVLVGVADDLFYWITTGFSKDGGERLQESATLMASAGQKDVETGVKGLLALKNSNTTTEDPIIVEGLVSIYKEKILKGSAITIIYIIIFFLIIHFLGKALTSISPPWALSVGLAIFFVGLMSLFTGGGFYNGWYVLATNFGVMGEEFYTMISPLPAPVNVSG